MNLFYLTRARLPNKKAHCIQIFNTCSGFARIGTKVRLLASHSKLRHGTESRPGHWPRKPDDYAGVEQSFPLVRPPYGWWQRILGVPSHERMIKAFADDIRKHRGDQHAVYTRSSEICLRMVRLGIPCALEVHDQGWLEGKYFQELIRTYRADGANSFLGLVAISRTLADILVANGVPAAGIGIAHDGIDTSRFDPDRTAAQFRLALLDRRGKADPPSWLAECDPGLLDPARPVIGYCGHYYAGRGIGMLVECAARRPEWTFLLIGGFEEDVAPYREQARSRGLKNVIFLGYVRNTVVPTMLQCCDILSMPYEYTAEGSYFMSPMKMFEYLAAGRAIVSADWPQIREVIRDGEEALLHPRGDVDALEAAISRICSDPSLRESLASRARELSTHHTWEARARNILAWLEQRLAEKNL